MKDYPAKTKKEKLNEIKDHKDIAFRKLGLSQPFTGTIEYSRIGIAVALGDMEVYIGSPEEMADLYTCKGETMSYEDFNLWLNAFNATYASQRRRL